MALRSVGARTEGDVVQGLFFWREAARLLVDGSVIRVDLEHDDADGVDDVAAFYAPPGAEAGGFHVTADFYQLKYHVDQRSQYTATALIDPTFIGATRSLLQRFHGTYQKLRSQHTGLRLHLASNWRWGDDKLGRGLREYDGALPDEFFTSPPRSQIGTVRETWRRHLAVTADEFTGFARTLRFQTDHFGRRWFRESVHDRLALAGLRAPPDSRAASKYESLTQRFLMDKRASFDRDTFRELCRIESLFDDKPTGGRRSRTVGIRSFHRFAENLEDEAATVVSVVDQFCGRHPRTPQSWPLAAATILESLGGPLRRGLREEEHEVMLECQGSLALLAGYELSTNSGARVYPVQKPGRDLWQPRKPYTGDLWISDVAALAADAESIVVSLSVTHDIRADVDAFIRSSGLFAKARVDLRPASGPGPVSVDGADHAAGLAAALVAELRMVRPTRGAVVHLFSAAPNALLFFLGQHREALGRLQLYEFDFGLERDGSYAASITIPPGPLET